MIYFFVDEFVNLYISECVYVYLCLVGTEVQYTLRGWMEELRVPLLSQSVYNPRDSFNTLCVEYEDKVENEAGRRHRGR